MTRLGGWLRTTKVPEPSARTNEASSTGAIYRPSLQLVSHAIVTDMANMRGLFVFTALYVVWQCDGGIAPFPLDSVVNEARAAAKGKSAPFPYAGDSSDYLQQIAGTVLHFSQFQNKNSSSPLYGKIIDPYTRQEMQYSTPCYAFAGATLLKHKYPGLPESFQNDVFIAASAALKALVYGQPHGDQGCADGHCNFYNAINVHHSCAEQYHT